MREEKHRTQGHKSDITPPSGRRVLMPYNIQWGGGGARSRVTGRKASRAAPVPGPTVEQGARGAMADPGTREAMADLPPRPRPQPPPWLLRLEPYYPPPKKILEGAYEA